MRLGSPLAGPLLVTQPFGARPEVYAKFKLPGHDGLDLRAETGTAVRAVDDGTVGLASDKGAYGLHYRLVHPWGESVYAHLSKQLVSQGQRVARGQTIGLSGNTGNSDGPHLHVGLRVAPFIRDGKVDKWQGFCDPMPYFHAEQPLIGPHIINGNGSMLETLRRWQPAVITVLDPDPMFLADVYAVCPKTQIVGRIYRPDGEVADRIKADPAGAAQWMHELVTGHPAYAGGKVDYWQVANEVCQGSWEDFVKLDACMIAWIVLAQAHYGCALYGFGVGNPEAPVNDRNWWNQITPTLQRAVLGKHVLLVHEYGCCPDVYGPLAADGKPATAWYAQRYVNQVRPYLQARQIKVIVSEFGYDGMIGGGSPKGWQKSGMSAEQYANHLLAFGEMYGRYRDQILGVCVYTWGSNSPWETYDITGEVANILADKAMEMRGLGDGGIGEDGGQKPEDGGLVAAGWAAARAQRRLALNAGAALQKAMAAAGLSPVTDEFGFSHDGVGYVGQLGERLDRADKAKLFFCPVGKWDDVRQEVER